MAELGPRLPPGWAPSCNRAVDDEEDDDEETYGPKLPPAGASSGETNESDVHTNSANEDCPTIGVALPPHLQRNAGKKADDDENCDEEKDVVIGPALPPHLQSKRKDTADEGSKAVETYGVSLPPDYSRWNTFDVDADADAQGDSADRSRNSIVPKSTGGDVEEEEEDDDTFGPALPPGLLVRRDKESKEIPSHSSNQQTFGSTPVDEGNSDDDDDDDDIIGPMPLAPGREAEFANSAADEFERRSNAMRHKLQSQDEPKQPSRESWMTELPGYSTNFGLGPRSFRKTARPDGGDRSVWTDTPADKARKAKERAEGRSSQGKAADKKSGEPSVSNRDKKLAGQVDEYNKAKRGESLVDMHSKARKRKLEEQGAEPQERRPFSREHDLQVNRFDDAARKRLIKKSAELNTRFSHSSDKVYL
ncbi:GPALPP motifs-containing protein 1-like [Diadema antillarum]|uniref:GPALPP motifs-containing protein 1-like n=1 Tax=Diadema antillarum TaxID=105358 RepID=UPI003A88C7D0